LTTEEEVHLRGDVSLPEYLEEIRSASRIVADESVNIKSIKDRLFWTITVGGFLGFMLVASIILGGVALLELSDKSAQLSTHTQELASQNVRLQIQADTLRTQSEAICTNAKSGRESLRQAFFSLGDFAGRSEGSDPQRIQEFKDFISAQFPPLEC